MPSIHELKARSCPQPDKLRGSSSSHSPNPNARFGWEVVRRMQAPPPRMQVFGEFDVTPERILTAMRGQEVFPEPPPEPEASGRRQMSQADIDWKAIKEQRERNRKSARLLCGPQARRMLRNGSVA